MHRMGQPVRSARADVFVLIDGAIAEELRGSTGPLELFDQVLG